jgi:hypothetical protein
MVILGGVRSYPNVVCYEVDPFPPSDVGYESYKAHRRGPTPFEAAHFTEPTRVGLVALKRSVFQSVASM